AEAAADRRERSARFPGCERTLSKRSDRAHARPIHLLASSHSMKLFIDVTSSCRSSQNTGMQRMTRRIFAELSQRLDVRPISWNTIGNFYIELGPRERLLLTRPFAARSGAMAHPEWRGEDPFTEFFRMLRRRRVYPDQEISATDVFFVPDIFRDGRRDAL